MMAVSVNKLPPRYSISDWTTSNVVLRTNAENSRDSSHKTRQEGRRLRNETDDHTRWTQHDTDTKLEKKIEDLNEWKEALERCLFDTDREIISLQNQINELEKALEAKKIPLDAALQCLILRENRHGIDLVRDKVEYQLHKEVEVIEGIKALLQQKIAESFEQLRLLEEARHQLQSDLTNKNHALQIDSECFQMNNESKDIDFQINPTRTVKGSVTPEVWNSFSLYNKHKSEVEMKSSQCLRESIFATLEKTKNDLNAQHRATEYEFRKRIHETKQTKNELEWQQKNTKDEISTMEQDIRSLEEAIDDKMAPMKVAQTRLEKRTHRKNVELCRDAPQYQLCHEVGEIELSVKALSEKLQTSESAFKCLLQNLKRIEHDLAVKTRSLQLDNHCMELRENDKETTLNESAVDNQQQLFEKMSKTTIQEKADETVHVNDNISAGEVKIDTSQFAHEPIEMSTLRSEAHENNLLQSTYNFDYDDMKTKRSGDLQRTLGKSTYETTGSRLKQVDFA